MASANLDLVRSIYAASERGEFNPVEWARPEIEYVQADGPTVARWSGVAGLTDGFRDFESAWRRSASEQTSTASSTVSVSSC